MKESVKIKIESITKLIELTYGFSFEILTQRNRKKDVVKARHILYYVLHVSGLSYSAISKLVNRDHTTVIYGIYNATCKWKQEIDSLNIEKLDPTEFLDYKNPYMTGDSKKWNWVYKMFNGKCAICGFSNVIQVHHIKPRSLGGSDDISNLIVLCPNHHALLHLGLVDISKLSTPIHISTPPNNKQI